jgi:hypothetical protein
VGDTNTIGFRMWFAALNVFVFLFVFILVKHDFSPEDPQSRCETIGMVIYEDGLDNTCVDNKNVLHPIPKGDMSSESATND